MRATRGDTHRVVGRMTMPERRQKFLTECGELLGQEKWATVIRRVVSEGPSLGRSKRWQDAIAWHTNYLTDPDAFTLDWIARQGHIWLVHANA